MYIPVVIKYFLSFSRSQKYAKSERSELLAYFYDLENERKYFIHHWHNILIIFPNGCVALYSITPVMSTSVISTTLVMSIMFADRFHSFSRKKSVQPQLCQQQSPADGKVDKTEVVQEYCIHYVVSEKKRVPTNALTKCAPNPKI